MNLYSNELNKVREILKSEDKQLNIGIFLERNVEENIIEKFKSLILDQVLLHEEILLDKYSYTETFIQTASARYRLFESNQYSARGNRFHKIYYDNCSQDFLDNILMPITSIGMRLNIKNTVEKL